MYLLCWFLLFGTGLNIILAKNEVTGMNKDGSAAKDSEMDDSKDLYEAVSNEKKRASDPIESDYLHSDK